MGPPVGTVVFKFFPFYGKFKGRVEMLRPNAKNGKCIRVRFEDGDMGGYDSARVSRISRGGEHPYWGSRIQVHQKVSGGLVHWGSNSSDAESKAPMQVQ